MAQTPPSVKVEITLPLYVKTPDGEYVEIGTFSTDVEVPVTLTLGGQG